MFDGGEILLRQTWAQMSRLQLINSEALQCVCFTGCICFIGSCPTSQGWAPGRPSAPGAGPPPDSCLLPERPAPNWLWPVKKFQEKDLHQRLMKPHFCCCGYFLICINGPADFLMLFFVKLASIRRGRESLSSTSAEGPALHIP